MLYFQTAAIDQCNEEKSDVDDSELSEESDTAESPKDDPVLEDADQSQAFCMRCERPLRGENVAKCPGCGILFYNGCLSTNRFGKCMVCC